MPSALLDALRSLPGGERLLAASSAVAERTPVHLVGGSVRDLTRGVMPHELDVVVEGDIGALLQALGGADVVHDRFATASASVDGARVDVTTSRRERYARPGALPEVEPAPLAEDLLRRDFTVNAIAVSLPHGELCAAPHAQEDLARGLLRVMHDASFVDDPTRLWRLGRYAARLRFSPEQHTAELARAALAAGAPATLSGTRIGAELRLALGEEDAPSAVRALRTLGVLASAGIDGDVDEPTMRDALSLLPDDGRPDLLLLAALLAGPGARGMARDDSGAREEPVAGGDGSRAINAGRALERLAFGASDRDRVVAAVRALPTLLRELPASSRPSRLHALAAGVPIEAVALAGALARMLRPGEEAALRENAERWLEEVRNVRVQITGDDLIAAGVPEGPEIGRRLRAVLDRRLDGELADGREAELRAALESS